MRRSRAAKIRAWLRRLAGALLAVASATAFAQAYPSKPIRFIVPFSAGAGTDVFSRALASKLQAQMGQPVLVENQPSSSGIVALNTVLRAAPDGHTLVSSGSWAVTGTLVRPRLGFDMEKDFTPIALIADADLVLYVHTSTPYRTLMDLVEDSKANPDKLSYAASGHGHIFHLPMELLQQKTGAKLTFVPYKGMAPALQDLIAGRLQVSWYLATGQALDWVKRGYLRGIAVTGERRNPLLPDVPTLAESGIRDFLAPANAAIMGPANMPRAIVDRLNSEIRKATSSADMLLVYEKLNFIRLHSTPEEYAKVIRAEVATWGSLIKALNITVD